MERHPTRLLHALSPTGHLLANVAYPDDRPCFVADALEGPSRRELVALVGSRAHLQFEGPARCRGYWDLDSLLSYPCPDGTFAMSGFCPICRTRTGFNPAFYNVAPSSISPQQRRYNDRPHAVYLAAFGDGVIKVGISHLERLRSRWLEQGARVAVVVTIVENASSARAVEAAAVGQFGILERLTNARKVALLRKPFDRSGAAQTLEATCRRLCEALRIDREEWPAEELDDVYFGGPAPELSLLGEPAVPFQETGGLWFGLIGQLACVESARGPLVYDLSSSFGKSFRIVPEISASQQPVALKPIQTQLF